MPKRFARRPDEVVDGKHVLARNVQFPTELADVVDTQRKDARVADVDRAHREPRERVV